MKATTVLRQCMSSRNLLPSAAIIFFLIFAGTVSASYSGDEPLSPVFYDELNGGYVFSTGDSIYSGQMNPGDYYNASFDIAIPSDAVPVFSRLYVYWAWSNLEKAAIYPSITVSATPAGSHEFTLAERYVDSKGFVSSYDFFSGTDSYEVTGIGSGENSFSVTVGNSAADNSTFVIEGLGLLVVYESPSSPLMQIWADEGCDMLYNDYGITPEMATATAVFNGTVDTGSVKSARIELVAPSGGYTRSDIPDKNVILFNRDTDGSLPGFLESLISAIFPGYNGKEWIDCFDSDELRQVGIESRDVGPYLKGSNNIVRVRDRGDYMLFTNAILSIEKEEE